MIAMCKAARRPISSAFAAFAVLTMLAGACAAEDVRLTQASVKQFIASYPAVKAIAVRQANSKGQNIKAGKEALAAVVEAASDKAVKSEIDTAVRAHGFRDAKEWTGVAKSVGLTYAHLKLSADDAKNRQKLEKTIAKIEKNDLLTDKAKRKLIDAMRGGADAVLEPPSPENVAVLKPMLAEIEAVVKK